MTKHPELKCPICGGNQKPAETTFTVDLGFGVVVIRQVPAFVCEICGEELIHDEVAASLEQIVEQARERHRTVEIVSYDRETQYSLAS